MSPKDPPPIFLTILYLPVINNSTFRESRNVDMIVIYVTDSQYSTTIHQNSYKNTLTNMTLLISTIYILQNKIFGYILQKYTLALATDEE